jgi:hypothetical protein
MDTEKLKTKILSSLLRDSKLSNKEHFAYDYKNLRSILLRLSRLVLISRQEKQKITFDFSIFMVMKKSSFCAEGYICDLCRLSYVEMLFLSHQERWQYDRLTGYVSWLYLELTEAEKISLKGRFASHFNFSTKTHKKHGNIKIDQSRIELRYGRRLWEWDALLIEQKNKCAVCSVDFDKVKLKDRDHNHKTGVARKWVCRSCNIGLGQIEREGFLENALKYLEMHK